MKKVQFETYVTIPVRVSAAQAFTGAVLGIEGIQGDYISLGCLTELELERIQKLVKEEFRYLDVEKVEMK